MRYRYATADVFTERAFGGNPVAVVLDAGGLSTARMQALAVEFNYVETTFVLPPSDQKHTAHVRIFTPDREVPFAGHPNLGTAFILAREAVGRGEGAPERLVFEEAAGLVQVDLLFIGGTVVGAELLAPEPLSRRSEIDQGRAAACLGLTANDVCLDAHRPQVISVGLPSLVVEIASRDALRRARPDPRAFAAVLPLDGAKSVYAYTRDVEGEPSDIGCDLQARMFTPRMVEDPATGSATAAVAALMADLSGERTRLRVCQGVDMGRPSLLLANASSDQTATRASVGGRCAAMFEGSFDLG